MQVNLIKTFNKNYKQNSFMTYPKLSLLIERYFNKNENFNFLDFGGENIDCFFTLKKKFKVRTGNAKDNAEVNNYLQNKIENKEEKINIVKISNTNLVSLIHHKPNLML